MNFWRKLIEKISPTAVNPVTEEDKIKIVERAVDELITLYKRSPNGEGFLAFKLRETDYDPTARRVRDIGREA